MRSLAFTLILAASFAACSGSAPEESAPPPAPVANPVDAASAGSLTGSITLEGTPPAAETINRRSDSYCEGLGAATTQVFVLSNGGLQNVFVYIKDGLGGLTFPVPAAPVVLDQQGCTYLPRVFGIQAGQPLEIRNSDDTLHNINVREASARVQAFNVAIPTGGTYRYTFARDGFYNVSCDIHPAMSADIFAASTPHVQRADEEGRFAFEGVAPGSYRLRVLAGPVRLERDVEVSGAATEIDLTAR